jgi:hypothetical protein
MKRIIGLVAVVAALSMSAVAFASPAPGSTTCTDSSALQGKTITANLTVPAGATCNLSWSDVKGNVTVNGSLITFGTTTFEKNVSVVGGAFASVNWGVTINGNLSFLNPAVYSSNGFWGTFSPTEVKGNLSYTITADTVYPDYLSPLLYFNKGFALDGVTLNGVTVDGNFNYNDLGTGFPGHLYTGGLDVKGSSNVPL